MSAEVTAGDHNAGAEHQEEPVELSEAYVHSLASLGLERLQNEPGRLHAEALAVDEVIFLEDGHWPGRDADCSVRGGGRGKLCTWDRFLPARTSWYCRNHAHRPQMQQYLTPPRAAA